MMKTDFFLIGDSHAAAIGKAAQEAKLDFIGGPIGSGRAFFTPFFKLEGGTVMWVLPEAAAHIDSFLKDASVKNLESLACPLVSTIGFSPHFLATRANWALYTNADRGFDTEFLNSELFAALVKEMLAEPLAFYRYICGKGIKVWGVVAPQRVPALTDPQIFYAAQDIMLALFAETGLTLVDVRPDSTDANGQFLEKYCQPADELHANATFGALVLSQIKSLSGQFCGPA